MAQLLLLLTILVLLGILAAFWRKLNLQFRYLYLKETKKKLEGLHILSKNLSSQQSDIRNRSLMLFPLLLGVERLNEGEQLDGLKNRIRTLHLAIYLLLMAVVLLGLIGKGPAL